MMYKRKFLCISDKVILFKSNSGINFWKSVNNMKFNARRFIPTCVYQNKKGNIPNFNEKLNKHIIIKFNSYVIKIPSDEIL